MCDIQYLKKRKETGAKYFVMCDWFRCSMLIHLHLRRETLTKVPTFTSHDHIPDRRPWSLTSTSIKLTTLPSYGYQLQLQVKVWGAKWLNHLSASTYQCEEKEPEETRVPHITRLRSYSPLRIIIQDFLQANVQFHRSQACSHIYVWQACSIMYMN